MGPDGAVLDAGGMDASRTDGSEIGGCEDRTDREQLATDESSQRFEGRALGATGDGRFTVVGANEGVVRGTVATEEDGTYSVQIPFFCGGQDVELSWTVGECVYQRIVAVTRTACEPVDLQITLAWDELGRDWELHLIKPGGRINDDETDCTWTSCVGQSPDWGVIGDPSDDPVKDVDDTGTHGPENIHLNRPEEGAFTVMVEHWGRGDPRSSGEVIVNVRGRGVTYIPISNLAPQHVRYAAEIEWPSGTVTPLTTVLDCTDDWSRGCQAAIP